MKPQTAPDASWHSVGLLAVFWRRLDKSFMVFGFCSHMADARLADLLAEQATARRRAEQIAQSLSAIQAGRPETARL